MTEKKQKKKTKIRTRLLRSLLLFIVLMSCAVFFGGNYLLYYNQRYPIGNWDISTNIKSHEIPINKNTVLHGWYFPGKEGKEFMLFSHGNAGNITTRKTLAKMLQLEGYSVFLYDYRGYGKSTGKPSEKGLYEDIEAVFEYVNQKMRPQKIVLFGESLGSAISIYLAEKYKVHALILQSPFVSIQAISKKIFGFKLPKFILPSLLPSIDRIQKIDYPTMVIHGTDDKVVPFAHGQKIYEASPAKIKHFFTVKNAGHNGIYLSVGSHRYMSQISTFLEKIR